MIPERVHEVFFMTVREMMQMNRELKQDQQWFGASQLCKRLGIGKTTFYRWIDEGIFPEGKKIGKRAVRWHISTIHEFEHGSEEVTA